MTGPALMHCAPLGVSNTGNTLENDVQPQARNLNTLYKEQSNQRGQEKGCLHLSLSENIFFQICCLLLNVYAKPDKLEMTACQRNFEYRSAFEERELAYKW